MDRHTALYVGFAVAAVIYGLVWIALERRKATAVTDSPSTTVSSQDQSGGITAGTVNVGWSDEPFGKGPSDHPADQEIE